MNMTLGAEPKKVQALGGLLVLLLGVWWWSSSSDQPAGSAAGARPAATAPPPVVMSRREVPGSGRGPRTSSRQQMRSTVQDFKPKLFDKENPVDPTKVDPTLVTQTMARLQNVTLSGGGRSLFDFGASTAPVTIPTGPIIKPAERPKREHPFVGPIKPEDKPVVAEVKPPPPPPIPLKFYGFVFSKRQSAKRAFFMEGEEIYIAAEGESMKGGKYRLVKIGVNSATVEDVANKNQQALPLVEEQQPTAGGGA